jgi:hypothetical protein
MLHARNMDRITYYAVGCCFPCLLFCLVLSLRF